MSKENSKFKIVQKIINNIKKGFIFSQDLLDSSMLIPNNPITGTYYKGYNRIYLSFVFIEEGYNSNKWITYKQAKCKNLKPKVPLKGRGKTLEKFLFKEDEITGKVIPIRKYFTVFNIDLFNGTEKYLKSGFNNTPSDIAVELYNNSLCEIKTSNTPVPYYNFVADYINLPPYDCFANDLSFIHVMLHEMIHSTGHVSRLNRSLWKNDKESYAIEEIIAEFGAIFTSAELGLKLDTNLEHSCSNYILSYFKELDSEKVKKFIKALKMAETASEFLIKRKIEKLERNITK